MNATDVPSQAPVDPSDEGLAARVRAATAPQHRSAETRSFITALMSGELSLAAYTAYLAQYAWVYAALESRPTVPGDPALIADPRLARSAAIEADLVALGASEWRREHPPLPATLAYVDRLLSIADNEPRYVAHHYTRYLGDLSGGQAIAALVARHYGATPEQLSFYRFEGIDNPVEFKRWYREGLDGLDYDAAAQAALIGEAKIAFELNSSMFDGLAQVFGVRPATPPPPTQR